MTRVELRPVTENDADMLCDVINRANRHDGVPITVTIDEIIDEFDEPDFDPEHDARTAWLDGLCVGRVRIWNRTTSEGDHDRAFIFGEVVPEARRRGVGTEMMRWGMERAAERLRAADRGVPKFMRVDAYDYMTGAHRLFETVGFVPVRWFEELLRPLGRPADSADVPGITVIGWPHDRTEEVRRAKNTAFADHWGSTPQNETSWDHYLSGHGVRLDLSVAAIDDRTGAVVAHCVNAVYPDDEAVIGRRDGWIDNLGTLPEYRGRGIASALITVSLERFRSAGLTHASIGVDADSPTGAARLYRALGFEPRQRSIQYQLSVD